METREKNSRILQVLGAALTIAGLAFNKWTLEAFVIEDGHISELSTLISIGLLQIILILNGILVIIFSTRNPGKGFKYYIRDNRRSVEFLLFATIIFIWVVSISPPNYYTYIFGIYRPWLFATNIAITTIGLLAIYTLRDISSWKKRIINSSVFITTVILISFLLELVTAAGLIDYRELFIPRGVGFNGPHNRVFEYEGYFHRPANDNFSDNMPGDAVITLGAKTDRRYPAEYKYDDYGFRNSKVTANPYALLVGDSFIEGYKVTQDKIVSERLTRLLGKDTYNLAQADYSPYEELHALSTHIERISPKLVIWFFYEGNDLPDIGYQDFVQDQREHFKDQNSYAHRSFFTNLSSLVARWTSMTIKHFWSRNLAEKRSGHFIGSDRNNDTTMYFEFRPPQSYQQQLPRIRFVLNAVKELSDENEAQLLFVYIPTKYSVYKTQLQFPDDSIVADWAIPDLANQLEELCLALDIHFLDLNPAFKHAAANQDLVYFLDDAHWSPEGHEVVARELMNYMQKAGWLD